MPQNAIDNAPGFLNIRAGLIHSIGDVDELDAIVGALGDWRRENDELISIELRIREGNETSVLRAIVPLQESRRCVQHARDVEDALRIIYPCRRLVRLLLFFVGIESLEEGRRGKLHWVAYNHELSTAQYRSESILGFELRRLVHHD